MVATYNFGSVYSNMLANILPVDPHPNGWGQKVKIQLYQTMIMSIIKLKGIPHAAKCKHIFTPSTPGVVSNVKNIFYLKVVILHIKLMGMEHRAPCKHKYCPCTHPLIPGEGSEVQNIFFTESSRVAYQIEENET